MRRLRFWLPLPKALGWMVAVLMFFLLEGTMKIFSDKQAKTNPGASIRACAAAPPAPRLASEAPSRKCSRDPARTRDAQTRAGVRRQGLARFEREASRVNVLFATSVLIVFRYVPWGEFAGPSPLLETFYQDHRTRDS